MTFGEKYTEKEVNHFFEIAEASDNMMDCKRICDMLTGKIQDDEPAAN